MKLEISEVFLRNKEGINIDKLELEEPLTIKEILEKYEIKSSGYAMFFINDMAAKETDLVTNDDKLTILPIFGGG
jgi:sulfur carrier protein ThiS